MDRSQAKAGAGKHDDAVVEHVGDKHVPIVRHDISRPLQTALTGAWALPDEKRMIMVFVNISDQPVTATVNFDAAAFGIKADSVQIVTVTHDGKGEPTGAPDVFKRQLTFAPYIPWAWEISW